MATPPPPSGDGAEPSSPTKRFNSPITGPGSELRWRALAGTYFSSRIAGLRRTARPEFWRPFRAAVSSSLKAADMLIPPPPAAAFHHHRIPDLTCRCERCIRTGTGSGHPGRPRAAIRLQSSDLSPIEPCLRRRSDPNQSRPLTMTSEVGRSPGKETVSGGSGAPVCSAAAKNGVECFEVDCAGGAGPRALLHRPH